MNVLQIVNRGTSVDWYFKEHELGGPIPEVSLLCHLELLQEL